EIADLKQVLQKPQTLAWQMTFDHLTDRVATLRRELEELSHPAPGGNASGGAGGNAAGAVFNQVGEALSKAMDRGAEFGKAVGDGIADAIDRGFNALEIGTQIREAMDDTFAFRAAQARYSFGASAIDSLRGPNELAM